MRNIGGTIYQLDIVDTAGQEEYRGLLSSVWQVGKAADAYLLVYDITDPYTLKALDEFDLLIREGEEAKGPSYRPPPVKLVVGNKCDLKDYRAVPADLGHRWARKHDCGRYFKNMQERFNKISTGFMETSSLANINIEEAFESIVRKVAERQLLEQDGLEDPEITSTSSQPEPLEIKSLTSVQSLQGLPALPPLPSNSSYRSRKSSRISTGSQSNSSTNAYNSGSQTTTTSSPVLAGSHSAYEIKPLRLPPKEMSSENRDPIIPQSKELSKQPTKLNRTGSETCCIVM
ncbi:P-loop containing nucleoside triphosphate hydrolase protein [Lipomyces oligophaga]|uniref:P-loop containing nucleoside triphosphate hydrolase protein n=1 Tax=Lipomyces oligophaga TaxID=45792 RepID=UPI0034CF623A